MKKMRSMPYNLQFFAEVAGAQGATDTSTAATGADGAGSQAMSDSQELDVLLNGMTTGGQQQQQTQQQSDQQQQQQQSQQQQQQQTDQQQQVDKSNYAFGQMRKQIADLQGLLGKVAQANGIKYTTPAELLEKMNDDAISKMAQSQGVPVEVLRELESLKQDSLAYKEQRLKDEATVGFQNVMTQYGLTQDELIAFASELDADGKNPFAQQIDLVAEYKIRHFDDVINKRVTLAVREALAKSNNADQHSSTPPDQTPPAGTEPQKITTVAGLSDLLSEMK